MIDWLNRPNTTLELKVNHTPIVFAPYDDIVKYGVTPETSGNYLNFNLSSNDNERNINNNIIYNECCYVFRVRANQKVDVTCDTSDVTIKLKKIGIDNYSSTKKYTYHEEIVSAYTAGKSGAQVDNDKIIIPDDFLGEDKEIDIVEQNISIEPTEVQVIYNNKDNYFLIVIKVSISEDVFNGVNFSKDECIAQIESISAEYTVTSKSSNADDSEVTKTVKSSYANGSELLINPNLDNKIDFAINQNMIISGSFVCNSVDDLKTIAKASIPKIEVDNIYEAIALEALLNKYTSLSTDMLKQFNSIFTIYGDETEANIDMINSLFIEPTISSLVAEGTEIASFYVDVNNEKAGVITDSISASTISELIEEIEEYRTVNGVYITVGDTNIYMKNAVSFGLPLFYKSSLLETKSWWSIMKEFFYNILGIIKKIVDFILDLLQSLVRECANLANSTILMFLPFMFMSVAAFPGVLSLIMSRIGYFIAVSTIFVYYMSEMQDKNTLSIYEDFKKQLDNLIMYVGQYTGMFEFSELSTKMDHHFNDFLIMNNATKNMLNEDNYFSFFNVNIPTRRRAIVDGLNTSLPYSETDYMIEKIKEGHLNTASVDTMLLNIYSQINRRVVNTTKTEPFGRNMSFAGDAGYAGVVNNDDRFIMTELFDKDAFKNVESLVSAINDMENSCSDITEQSKYFFEQLREHVQLYTDRQIPLMLNTDRLTSLNTYKTFEIEKDNSGNVKYKDIRSEEWIDSKINNSCQVVQWLKLKD